MPHAYIIAGPNGAGKTSFALRFIPALEDPVRFINADLISAALSPFSPEKESFRAGRLMLQLIQESVKAQQSFAIETTLSSRNYLSHISHWDDQGYTTTLVYLSLANPELAIRRVAQRVSEGGHNIPEPTIRRRFARSQALFPAYCQIVDNWYHYENTDGQFHLTKSSRD